MSVRLGRLIRTASTLKPSQILWRSAYSTERRLARVAPRRLASKRTTVEPPPRRPDFPALPLVDPAAETARETLARLHQGFVRNAGITKSLGGATPNWYLGPQASDRLWVISLHYHEWLYEVATRIAAAEDDAALAETAFTRYLGDWLDRCTPHTAGARDLAWNSYAVSTRLIWWIRIFQKLETCFFAKQPELGRRFLASIAQQASFLARHLEWDVRANHILRNICALAWAGRFFSGRQAAAWLRRTEKLALAQFDEQIGVDGAHFEASPHYHLQAMHDVLHLGLLAENSEVRDAARVSWERMAHYLTWILHPDGDVPLLNDGSLSEPGEVADLLHAGSALHIRPLPAPQGGRWFSNVGHAVWRGDPWYVLFDLGAIAPDIQPGHGHADTLTIEASIFGRRLFVDPGTFHYDVGTHRQYDRSTDAHNTVCIDRLDSSEVWGTFRVGRRARVSDARVEILPHRMTATAQHDGYRLQPGLPMHRRNVTVEQHGALCIEDRLEGSGSHHASGGWLVDPAWSVVGAADRWRLACGEQSIEIEFRSSQPVKFELQQRPHHPRFGEEVSTSRIAWLYRGTFPLVVRMRASQSILRNNALFEEPAPLGNHREEQQSARTVPHSPE